MSWCSRLIRLLCVYEQNFSICGADLLKCVRPDDRSNRKPKATCGWDRRPGFQTDHRGWQSGQSERLPGQMGRALFLSKGFHERLHDGGEKLSARPAEVSAIKCRYPGRERGQCGVAQEFLR